MGESKARLEGRGYLANCRGFKLSKDITVSFNDLLDILMQVLEFDI